MAKKLLGTISGLLIAAVLVHANPKRPEPHFITWTLIYYTGETVRVF